MRKQVLAMTFVIGCLVNWQYVEGASSGSDIDQLRVSAEQGDADAQWKYGRCLEFGAGVAQNESVAEEWYHKSAMQENPDGIYQYARYLEEGKGKETSEAEVTRLYTRAAEQGQLQAQTALYKLAAEQGEPEDQYQYAVRLERGEGIDQDNTEAFRFLEEAAKQGHECAILRLSCHKGNNASQYKYALMLWEDPSSPHNTSESMIYLKKSALKQYPPAQVYLAHILYEGIYIEKDSAQADDMIRLAAAKGHKVARAKLSSDEGNPNAQYEYATYLEKGFDVPRAIPAAIRLYQLSAAQGNTDARLALERLQPKP